MPVVDKDPLMLEELDPDKIDAAIFDKKTKKKSRTNRVRCKK